MIGYIKGIVLSGNEKELIILTSGGVGYSVLTTSGYAGSKMPGDEAELFVETSVREDAIVLFGFRTEEEKELFNLLREVNKIGPKTALSILSSSSAEEISAAISMGDSSFFKKVSGVGPKTAERIIIDLKDKVTKIAGTTVQTTPEDRQTMNAQEGLIALGYNPIQVRNALNKVKNRQELRAEQIVREALRIINGK